METIILMLIAAAAGYAACIVTWPQLKVLLRGLDTEIDALRRKVRELETRLRG